MKFNPWLILLAFFISVFLVYKSRTFTSFIVSLIILTALFSVSFLFISKAILKFKDKIFSGFILYLLSGIIILSIIFLTLFVVFANFGAGPTMLTVVDKPAFFHNIFTGKCEFTGYGSSYVRPWYIRQGCNLDKPKLLDLAKKSNSYRLVINSCESLCNSNYDYLLEQFCDYSFNSNYQKLNCDDFVDCNNINCLNNDS